MEELAKIPLETIHILYELIPRSTEDDRCKEQSFN